MQPQASLDAVTGLGIRGDVAYGKSRRQVLLMDEETLSTLALAPGTVRENIVTQNLSFDGLVPGDRLRVGDVLLEITGPCTPCDFIDTIRPGLRREIDGRRGLLARVALGGTISIGSPIQLESNRSPQRATDA